MSSKFATLALLGGICAASAPRADIAATERHYGHYSTHALSPDHEAPHLAHLLAKEEHSNALDHSATEMLSRNAEYAEELIDHHSAEIPVFHVVHEPENELENTSVAPRTKPSHSHHKAPHHKSA